jgi:uncharacterized membrane protein
MVIFNLILIVVTFISGFFLYPSLPGQMPMHWNVRGHIDGYMAKDTAIVFFPILMLFMFIAFRILPSFDPKKEKYKLFKHEWEIMQTGIIGFFTYLHFVTLYISLHPGTELMPLMFIGLGALFIVMGNYMSKIRQNYFIGIKVPWTLASEDNWNKTHRFASWCFVIAGLVTFVEAFFIWYAPIIIFGSILLATMLPIVYSFLLYKKSLHTMKFVYIALIIAVLAIAALRLISGEDDWICSNGQWVKHGMPSAPMPTYPCLKK